MTVLAAFLLLLGTSIQMKTSLRELAIARREAIEWWSTEDELVDAESRWRLLKRWRARRLV